ncbi:hypothetical protein [Streptomyces fulvorobeus]|uniref:Transposase n=1 Tax=Streptomyces fulvorobeus TaxID=284028 RepID=A0A7J0CCG1_9ACTN|nr:hypothetical protein [Streptomyces fulvorobeus]GFN00211.1 hypothetical protein Sfulv_50210 [Streptomyces fulvorobeus]
MTSATARDTGQSPSVKPDVQNLRGTAQTWSGLVRAEGGAREKLWGFAHLKNWRVLGKVRTDPTWATALVRAPLVLANREVAR